MKDFETLGYFEEVFNAETSKCLGTRNVSIQPERQLGYHGKKEQTITEPIELQRGHKTVTLKASVKKPVKVYTMLQRKCGKLIETKNVNES